MLNFNFVFAVKPVDLEGVEGMQVSLPCPLAASTSDKVYMVLWFRDGVGIPLYRWEKSGNVYLPGVYTATFGVGRYLDYGQWVRIAKKTGQPGCW